MDSKRSDVLVIEWAERSRVTWVLRWYPLGF